MDGEGSVESIASTEIPQEKLLEKLVGETSKKFMDGHKEEYYGVEDASQDVVVSLVEGEQDEYGEPTDEGGSMDSLTLMQSLIKDTSIKPADVPNVIPSGINVQDVTWDELLSKDKKAIDPLGISIAIVYQQTLIDNPEFRDIEKLRVRKYLTKLDKKDKPLARFLRRFVLGTRGENFDAYMRKPNS